MDKSQLLERVIKTDYGGNDFELIGELQVDCPDIHVCAQTELPESIPVITSDTGDSCSWSVSHVMMTSYDVIIPCHHNISDG
jgi:hypothetical protein